MTRWQNWFDEMDRAGVEHAGNISNAARPFEYTGALTYPLTDPPTRTQGGLWFYTRSDEDEPREHPKRYWYQADGDEAEDYHDVPPPPDEE